jgi:hypothetical protein
MLLSLEIIYSLLTLGSNMNLEFNPIQLKLDKLSFPEVL